MSTTPKFRIDVKVHTLLMDSASEGPKPLVTKGLWTQLVKNRLKGGARSFDE